MKAHLFEQESSVLGMAGTPWLHERGLKHREAAKSRSIWLGIEFDSTLGFPGEGPPTVRRSRRTHGLPIEHTPTNVVGMPAWQPSSDPQADVEAYQAPMYISWEDAVRDEFVRATYGMNERDDGSHDDIRTLSSADARRSRGGG